MEKSFLKRVDVSQKESAVLLMRYSEHAVLGMNRYHVYAKHVAASKITRANKNRQVGKQKAEIWIKEFLK